MSWRLRFRFPLAAKMALWLMLNMALLAAGGWWFFRSQFQAGFDTFLGAAAAPRVEGLADAVNRTLFNARMTQWTELLRGLSSVHGVPLAVYENSGNWVAGDQFNLPQALKVRLAAPANGQPPPPRNDPPPPRTGHPPDPNRPPPQEDRPRFGPADPGRPPFENRPPDGSRPDEPQIWPKFIVTAGNPSSYWVVVRAPLSAQRHAPMSLIVRCDSVSSAGLLLDTRPFVFAGTGAIIFSILFWLPFAFGLTRRVGRITAATAQVARGNFEIRLPDSATDELGELAHSVNAMAGQLDNLVRGQKRFLGDVAHELCSPLARMQTALAILEQRATDEKQIRYVGTLREELDDISRLVDELLQFSRASVVREPKLQAVPLAPLVAETVAREAAGAEVECDVPSWLTAQAEPRLLARALGNVLRNAVRYAGGSGPIVISAAPQGDRVNLVVSDNGPGVPIDSLPRLFDAFYRPDTARTRETGGTGLGLAIVKTCIEACRGTVVARLSEPRGLEVCFTLPVAG